MNAPVTNDDPHMPINRKWSAVEKAFLRTGLQNHNKTYPQVASELGRTINAVAGKVHRMKKEGLW